MRGAFTPLDHSSGGGFLRGSGCRGRSSRRSVSGTRTRASTLTRKGSPALRDTENVPLGESVVDAKDGGVGRVGNEINFNRYFYTYTPRPLAGIEVEIKSLEAEILGMVQEMMG